MTVQFFGRISYKQEFEDLQEPLKEWLRRVLEAAAPESSFVVVLKAFVHYEQPMPRIRSFTSVLAPRDITVEVFIRGEAQGLSYALYLPDEADREVLMLALEANVASFE